MLKVLLKLVGSMPPEEETAAADDQTYSEAAIDNAIVDSGRTIDQLNSAAALGSRANAMLREGIDRLKISGADSIEMIARATHRH